MNSKKKEKDIRNGETTNPLLSRAKTFVNLIFFILILEQDTKTSVLTLSEHTQSEKV